MVRSKLASALLLVAALAFGMMTTPAKAQVNPGSGLVINDINLTGVAYNAVTHTLTATGGTVTGTLAGLPFTTNITNFALNLVPNALPGQTCSVLNLELAPIHLALLGLHADTSPICLSLTAIEGGGLLGDLLCGVAGGDLTLLNDLLGTLEDILSGTLAGLAPPQAAQQAQDNVCTGDCEVLDLVLGPVDLTLLGLNVNLDDCDNGPVEGCVSATASEGLLGSLLCGLADGGLLGNLDLGLLQDLLDTILGALGNATPNATNQQVNQLVNQVGRAISDGNLSTKETGQITKSVQKIVRKG
jgi:hypothetical protein